jgi:hypothetical protein
MGLRTYLVNVLIGVDQLGNTLLGGYPDETISARAGRLRARPFWKQLAWLLDKIQYMHVERAVRGEQGEVQQDPFYRPAK